VLPDMMMVSIRLKMVIPGANEKNQHDSKI
jgi:hypothetical protein